MRPTKEQVLEALRVLYALAEEAGGTVAITDPDGRYGVFASVSPSAIQALTAAFDCQPGPTLDGGAVGDLDGDGGGVH